MALDGAERQPDEINELTALVVEFVDRFKNIENEITLLKESQKELVEEYSDRLDVKTLQAAMRTVKIKKKVSYKDTFDTFVDILSEHESI
ncbi:hypothetical protein EBU71_07070 [bacterium]|jgi:uncharacterized protein (UPF0335 family)|nr:hypothetical protein [Candidatus Elulimicrobium humile]